MELKVINQNTDFWANTQNGIGSPLTDKGYTLFLKDGTTNKYKRVIYANGNLGI